VRWNAIRGAVAALLLVVVVAPGAGASPAADFNSIVKDYTRDQKVTPCLFTQAQLEGARSQLGVDANAYSPGLSAAIGREIKRWKDGGCTAKKVAAAAGPKLRIVSVQPKGGARAESVTIRNLSGKTVNLRGFALRDAGDHTLKFRSTKLKRGARLHAVTGCRKGSKKAERHGTRYYFCRSKQVWDDAGDTVELLGRGGGLLSRRTYGTPPAATP
jgi:hypothetical protein